jgi:hypothetical protein
LLGPPPGDATAPVISEQLGAPVSDTAAAIVAGYHRQFRAEICVVVSRKDVCARLDVKASYGIELERLGVLRSTLEGGARRIPLVDVYTHLIRNALRSYPADGRRATARQPSQRFTRATRPRTPRSLPDWPSETPSAAPRPSPGARRGLGRAPPPRPEIRPRRQAGGLRRRRSKEMAAPKGGRRSVACL